MGIVTLILLHNKARVVAELTFYLRNNCVKHFKLYMGSKRKLYIISTEVL